MKITSSKLDEIRRRRDEWEADYEAKKAIKDEEQNAYRRAYQAVEAQIEAEVEAYLSKYTIPLEVTADLHWTDSFRVNIRSGSYIRSVNNAPLSWEYDIKLSPEGEVKMESNSWSGLNATTAEDIDYLYESVEAIKTIINLDWASILNKQAPNWRDYNKAEYVDRRNRPNFEAEEKEAIIEDLVGTRIGIRGKAVDATGYWPSQKGYYIIDKLTPKQLYCWFVADGDIRNDRIDTVLQWAPLRIKKSTLYPVLDVNDTKQF